MKGRGAVAALAVVLVIVAVPAFRHLREQLPPPPPAIRAAFAPPEGATFGAGDVAFDGAIAPDGSRVAFVATSAGTVALWLRAFADDKTEILDGTQGAALPAWKSGGRALAFFADGALKQVSLVDHSIRLLARAPTAGGATWLPDGSLLFAPGAEGVLKRLRDGALTDATRLSSGDRVHLFPSATANGFVYVAVRADGSRVVRYVRNGDEHELGPTSSHAEVVSGILVRVRDGVLMAQALDPETQQAVGRGVPLAPAIGVSRDGHGFFAASNRMIVAAPPVAGFQQVTWFNPRGEPLAPITEPGDYWQVRLSPDDRYAAVTALDPQLRTLDVFTVPLDSPSRAQRLSLSLGADSDPVWAGDSRRVAFRSLQSGTAQVLTRAPGDGGPETPLPGTGTDDTPSDWRGDQLLVSAPSHDTRLDVWLIDLAARTRERITSGSFNEWDARWSPDGRAIAFVSDESGQPDVYVDAWPRGGRRVRVTFAGGRTPQWTPDGEALVFMRANQIMRARRITGRALSDTDGFEFATPELLLAADGVRDFALTHRDGRLAVVAGAVRARPATSAIIDWAGLLRP